MLTFQGARIADYAPQQAVIVRVGRCSQACFKLRVELVFKRLPKAPGWNIDPQTLEPRRGDKNQQRQIRKPVLRKIGQALLD